MPTAGSPWPVTAARHPDDALSSCTCSRVFPGTAQYAGRAELSEPARVAEETVRLLSPPRANTPRNTMPRMPRIGGIVTAIVAVIVLIVGLSAGPLLPQVRDPVAETPHGGSQPGNPEAIHN